MYAPLNLYDTAVARMIDTRATALLGGDAYLLMQRAGQAAWQLLVRRWPQARRLVVLCGTGNNGGDGYVLARLAQCAGWHVRVVHLPGHGPRVELAQRARADYLAAGGVIELFPCLMTDADLIVDALFGIGMHRAPEPETAVMIAAVNESAVPVLALDMPSGIDADRGVAFGIAVRATVTLQFIVPHVGLYTGDALEYVGTRLCAPLDIPEAALAGMVPCAQCWGAEALAAFVRPRRRNTHKGESGRVLCVGGNLGSGGAVMLSAEAALRSGAGLVQVATRHAHLAPLLVRCPEVMVSTPETADALLPLIALADVIAVGPGLGQDAWAVGLYAAVMARSTPRVVDADALNLLAQSPMRQLDDTILTPHPGEAGRLLGQSAAQVQRDRLAAAVALSERFGAVVVLKGAGTVVAEPRHIPRIIDAGNAGMAVGGMGDVLTGVIAALRGQGWNAFDAASLGALLHGCAGDAAAEAGERGLLPTDVIVQLRHLSNPESFRTESSRT